MRLSPSIDMKRKLKQGKIQVTFEFSFIGSDEAFEKEIIDAQVIESYVGYGLQSAMDCHKNIVFDDDSIKAIIINRIDNVEDYQT